MDSPAAAPAIVHALARRFADRDETHISWLFFGADEVFKVKKPVHYPYLDFSTLERRRVACEAEVILNRRLSPDVYLGVTSLALDANGQVLFDAAQQASEFAVHMRRLPDRERADILLERNALTLSHLEALATHLVTFHAAAEIDRDPVGPGSTATLASHVEENLASLTASGRAVLGAAAWSSLCAGQRAALDATAIRRRDRLARGRVRDGHGDLRLDHVYFSPSGIRVLDCIEFDRAFRVADVCADVAFFAMNLYQHGRAAWAEHFVARYAREAADHELYALLDFYLIYWALVRAKVADARAAQTADDAQRTHEAARNALLRLAQALTSRPSTAQVIAVGGVIGSGKSHVAEHCAALLSCPILQSDRLRKQLAGLDPHEPLTAPEAYSAEATDQLYRELLERARIILASGRPVVVDATFREHARRAALRQLAGALGVPLRFLECHAPRAVLEERLRDREEKRPVSDARLSLLAPFLSSYEPLTDEELRFAHRIDTSGPRESTHESVRALLERPGRVFTDP